MKKTPERKHLFNFDQNVGFNKKYTTIAIYAMLVLVFGVVCVYFLLNNDKYVSVFATIKGIVFPIFAGMVLAYILNPILNFFEQKVFISSERRTLNKLRRKLFREKLAYDHLRNESDSDEAAVEKALETLTQTKASLKAARAAVQALEDKRIAKQIAKAEKKDNKPSYHKPEVLIRTHPCRGISLLCTYLVFIAVLTLILWIVIPQCIESVSGLVAKISTLINTLPSDIEKLIAENELAQHVYQLVSELIANDIDIKGTLMNMLTKSVSNFSSYLSGKITPFLTYVYSALSSITNLILALFFSVYFLSSKELLGRQAHKVGKALFSTKVYKGICHVIFEIDHKFGQFIEGKILDSTIIGIFALIVLWIVKMPYYQMLALVIGITNIIPFFGPIIGGVIGGAIVLISDPSKLIIFLIIVLIIQQIDGNVLGPLILGDSLGLQPIWIMIAIVIMSSLFGFFGMLFGVPLFAVIYTLVRELIDKRLQKMQAQKSSDDEATTDDDPQ